MKKKFTFICCAIMFLSSCENDQSEKLNHANNKSLNVSIDESDNIIVEKNLKMQLEEYLVAFNNGDLDKAFYYTDLGFFEYLIEQYPDEKMDIQEFKNTYFEETINQTKKFRDENKITYEFEIGNITKKVNYKTNKLYLVSALITANGKFKISIDEELLGISNDKGINWKFLKVDRRIISDILRMKFPQNIIDEILTKD